MTFGKTIALAGVLALSAGAASALGVQITGGENLTPLGNNNFAGNLLAGTTFLQGKASSPLVFSIVGAPSAVFTFTEVGAESGFKNSFTFDNGPTSFIFSEIANFGPGYTPSTGDEAPVSVSLAQSDNIASFLTFTAGSTPNVDYGPNANAFGVFFDAAKNTAGSLTTFWLALDDQNTATADDNHDDYVIRVDVAAVPLPAAAWLLLAASGGLIAAKRRSKRRAV